MDAKVGRDREHVGRNEPDRERQQQAQGEPRHHAGGGQQHHLRQIDREHLTAAGAQTLERRDRRRAAREMGLDGQGDAQAAGQERRQPGKGEEGREPVGDAGDLGLDVARAARAPTRIRPGPLQLAGEDSAVATLRQGELVLVGGERAGQEHLRGIQRAAIDQQTRPQAVQPAKTIGLAQEHGTDRDLRVPHPHPVADPDAEPGEQRRLGHAAPIRQRGRQRHRRIEQHGTEQWISSIHGLEVDRHGPARGTRQRVEADLLAQRCTGGHEPGQVVRRNRAIGLLELDVAAEKLRAHPARAQPRYRD